MDSCRRNGLDEEELVRDPGFADYLAYFVRGPQLPANNLREFCALVRRDAGTSGEVLDQMRRYARTAARKMNADGTCPNEVGEEFFKQAIECGGLAERFADAVRRAAMSAR